MAIWDSVEFDDHEQVCAFCDPATGLRAIVAIHSTVLGPAAGGTRFKAYATEQDAIDDALRLSKAMSYKSALAGLPTGGGKAVIIGDPATTKTTALLHAYGRFIDRIGHTFATGEDVGMSAKDIETVGEQTRYVGGTSAGLGDPSLHTAVGVVHGLRAVIRRRFGKSDFAGIRVAVQGLGAVGYGVAERLRAGGASLVVADLDPVQVERAVEQLQAQVVSSDAILAADVDLLVPCALGGIITRESAQQIRAGAVAGAANNQLASVDAGLALAERGILFAPDYVLNAGGIISGITGSPDMPGRPALKLGPLEVQLARIGDRLEQIFARAEQDGSTPEATAEKLAREMVGRPERV
jgi:leucine dehydrogenase